MASPTLDERVTTAENQLSAVFSAYQPVSSDRPLGERIENIEQWLESEHISMPVFKDDPAKTPLTLDERVSNIEYAVDKLRGTAKDIQPSVAGRQSSGANIAMGAGILAGAAGVIYLARKKRSPVPAPSTPAIEKPLPATVIPEPATKSKPHPEIFISYSTHDSHVANAICHRLEEQGMRCWIAPRDIIAGTDWSAQIIQSIRSCKIFVLVFTNKSNSSRDVFNEVSIAAASGLHLINFRLEAVPPSDRLQYHLHARHWLDAVTPPIAQHIEQLAIAIKGVSALDNAK